MIPAPLPLWCKAVVTTARDFRQRMLAGALDLSQAGAARSLRVRERFIMTTVAGHNVADRYAMEARARWLGLASAISQQRHGTWLILFGLLFTLLWLLAGWIGVANGVWRGILVGIVTPLAVNALFPLRRSAR